MTNKSIPYWALCSFLVAILLLGCGKTTKPEESPPQQLVWVWFYTIEEPYQGYTRLETEKRLLLNIDWTYELKTRYRVLDSPQAPPDEIEAGEYEVRKATATYLIDGGRLSPLQSDSEIVFDPQDKEAYKMGWEIRNQDELILVRPDGYTETYEMGRIEHD